MQPLVCAFRVGILYTIYSGVTKPGPTRAWARASILKYF